MLGGAEDLDLLYPIVTPAELERPLYSEMDADGEEGARTRAAYYQIFTHAVVAMKAIAKRCGKEDALAKTLRKTFDDEFSEKIINAVTFGKPASSLGVEIGDFLDHSRR
jgi:hypothetical protein